MAKARFLQEARAASALDHPNICTVHEVDETDDGQIYLAMPSYDGETLEAPHRGRGPLPVGEAVDIAIQIGQGLAKAHRQGIVHRDIKPANLIRRPTGAIMVADFGIAKILNGQMASDQSLLDGRQFRPTPSPPGQPISAMPGGRIIPAASTGKRRSSGQLPSLSGKPPPVPGHTNVENAWALSAIPDQILSLGGNLSL